MDPLIRAWLLDSTEIYCSQSTRLNEKHDQCGCVGAGSGTYPASCPLATAFLQKATGSKVKRQDQP